MATKVKALQMWCKKMAEGYRDVEVRDMTSSWKDGLAFCAIIHRFRPDLIDFDSLSKENIFDNNKLAFDVAESELGIPALLDAPDMVAIRVPDKLSIVTYVSQYYNYFHNKPQLGGPGVKKPSTLKRHQPSISTGPDAKRQSLTPSDGLPNKDRQVSMGDKCAICHKKVYLLERQVAEGQLYHRTCFRSSEISPQSKIYHKLDAMTDKDSDKHTGQKGKLEEPDFWKRRAEAKKAEKKVNGHLSDESANHIPKHDGKDLHSNVRHSDHNHNHHHGTNHDTKEKDHHHHNHGANHDHHHKNHQGLNHDSKDKEQNWRKSSPLDLKLDAKHSGSNDTKNLTSHITVGVSDKKSPAASPQPKARHVAKIGAFKDKREEEPMDTSSSADSKAKTKSGGVGNLLDRLKPTPKTEVKKEEEKKEVTVVPRARRVVKIGAKQDNNSSETKRTKSPPPGKVESKVLTPDSEPPPLPSSQPPAIKVSTPTSPPPLPSNLPPQLSSKSDSPHASGILPSPRNRSPPSRPVSSPVHISSHSRQSQPEQPHSKESPKAKPRNLKTTEQNVSNRSSDIAPSKPPRASANLEETSRKSTDSVSQVMSPTKEDQALLGGLLKNLAGIRQRKMSDESSDTSTLSPTGGVTSKLQKIPESKDSRREVKSLDIEKEKKKDRTEKSKSSFLSGKLSVFSTKDSRSEVSHPAKDSHSKDVAKEKVAKKDKEKPSLIASEDDDVPAWKKALEERKKQKNRPKSVDILSEQSTEPSWKSGLDKKTGKASPRPKSMDILSEVDKGKDQRPAWQIEAEKRAAARQSGFVDPEKAKLEQGLKKKDEKVDQESDKNVSKHRLLPSTPVTNTTDSEQDKKKITPDVKFRFSLDFDKKDKEKDAGKPPRPPSLVPSGPRWTNGVTEEGRLGYRQESPARLRSSEIKTFGDVKRLTPQEIQKQLVDIDSRLTDLEIRGRSLEDSIRKAQEEEEDENQMVEWFKLVNEKNELVRKEAELVYISRAQDLEDEQHELEQKIRRLDRKPEYLKTDADREEQEFLLNKLVEVVNQRSLIVDSQDEDRIRYEEEDRNIQEILETKGFCKEKEPTAGKKKEGKHEKKKKKKEKEK